MAFLESQKPGSEVVSPTLGKTVHEVSWTTVKTPEKTVHGVPWSDSKTQQPAVISKVEDAAAFVPREFQADEIKKSPGVFQEACFTSGGYHTSVGIDEIKSTRTAEIQSMKTPSEEKPLAPAGMDFLDQIQSMRTAEVQSMRTPRTRTEEKPQEVLEDPQAWIFSRALGTAPENEVQSTRTAEIQSMKIQTEEKLKDPQTAHRGSTPWVFSQVQEDQMKTQIEEKPQAASFSIHASAIRTTGSAWTEIQSSKEALRTGSKDIPSSSIDSTSCKSSVRDDPSTHDSSTQGSSSEPDEADIGTPTLHESLKDSQALKAKENKLKGENHKTDQKAKETEKPKLPPKKPIRIFRGTDKVKLGNGQAKPHGCSETTSTVLNFALLSPDSGCAWLVLIVPPGHQAADLFEIGSGDRELHIKLDPEKNRTSDSWHLGLTLSGAKTDQMVGIKYAWLIDPDPEGSQDRPGDGLHRLIDPYALVLDSSCENGWNARTDAKYSPLPVVPDFKAKNFDWQGVKSPGYEMKDLIIYEAHVRGFTRHKDSGVSNPGTFLGFVEKIPHLLNLGVNCVELLPIFEFDETAVPLKNPHTQEQLCNYWGYATVAFFVPMQRFASKETAGSAITEFKTLVRELHRNGIEVILDVVFNHTGEGGWGELNWASWCQVALPRYYLLSNGHHCNYTGCGNTMNANDGVCAEWICECLKYWACEMHVDGFRFDLAASLTRGSNGQVNLHDPYLIRLITEDPKLKHVKLIAEPWDCAWPDGHLVGIFPQGHADSGPPRWAEWNGEFRDVMRKFIKGDPDQKSLFASRLCGSSDLYKESGRSPFHSINFITAHDGFTLRDLVSYNQKQNSCNGEESGEDRNYSWNCVNNHAQFIEEQVEHLRQKQQKNLFLALLISHGTPMMTFGDEYGRTQNGCNNAWCQDALSWFSWEACNKQAEGMFRFCKLMIALRKKYSHILNRTAYATEEDLWWRANWEDPYNYLSYVMHASTSTKKYEGLLVAFNSGHEVYTCELPAGKEWYRIIDTNLEAPDDIVEDPSEMVLIDSPSYQMSPYSCILLTCSETFQEFSFKVHCDCSAPGEVVAIVGGPSSLGAWDPNQAIVCTTSAEEFPVWSSPVIGIPKCSSGKFEFKFLLKGEEHIHWEVQENHVVVLPETLQENERMVVNCAWGVEEVEPVCEETTPESTPETTP
jgi:isoamylase/glycogen operon protein